MSWAWSSPTKSSCKLPSEPSAATRRRIAVLGAPGTGAAALAEGLRAALGLHPAFEITRPGQPEPGHDLVLLMGLSASAVSPEVRAAQRQADTALRARLQALKLPFQVVYGEGPGLLNNALLALGLTTDEAAQAQREAAQFNLNRGRTPWSCEKCSDPDCEHRLFTGLLKP